MTVTAASLCREVGDTSYAKKHGLAVHIPAVWDALCTFVEDNLTAHKVPPAPPHPSRRSRCWIAV